MGGGQRANRGPTQCVKPAVPKPLQRLSSSWEAVPRTRKHLIALSVTFKTKTSGQKMVLTGYPFLTMFCQNPGCECYEEIRLRKSDGSATKIPSGKGVHLD